MGRARLEVALLGPVEVHRDGVTIPVPPGRPTVILAALAARPGTVVPVDALAGWLWPDDEPVHPRAAIQTHVARLRAALGDGFVQAAGDGYRLDLAPDAVDVTRFRELVAAGRDAEPVTELTLLREGLALWRGDPLAGLNPDDLEKATAPLLVEELLSATERMNELRLRLDRTDEEFVPSLRRLVAAHPWRERLWAQLMLALYRQGRQGDALAAYHEVVTVLRDELGIDPGPELTDLHRRILDTDPALLATAPGAGTAGGGASGGGAAAAVVRPPVQLPRSTAQFVGREHEIDLLTAVLSENRSWARLGLISGPGGSGKTTLALHVGHALREAHPDGQLFAELRGSTVPAEPGEVLAEFLRALATTEEDIPATLDERAALFRSACAHRRLLVVLDDARDAAQVTPLLPGAGGCSVLVTSRPQLSMIPSDVQIDLALFSDEDANELLESMVGRARLAAEPEATALVVSACKGSPLALRIAGGRLVTRPAWPIDHFAERLLTSRLDELEMGDLSVRAMLTASVQGLDPAIAFRFRLLAAVPGPALDVETAAATWDVSADDARSVLEHLVDVRLIDSAAPDEYRWHDLVDDHLRAVADTHRVIAARRRLVRYYLRCLHNLWPVLRPGGNAVEPGSWFPHEVQGHEFADRAEIHAWLHPHTALMTSLGLAGLHSEQQDVVDESAALLLALARARYECCREAHTEDLSRAVLDVPAKLGDPVLTARAWHALALSLGAQSRRGEALEAGARGLAVRRELGDRYGEVIMLHNMAVWHELDGRYEEAAELFERCAEADDVLSPEVRRRCRRNLAHVQTSLGRYDDARRNLELTGEGLGDEPGVELFDQLLVLAHLALETGAADEAVAGFQRAVAVAVELGSVPLQATGLVKEAHALRRSGHDGGGPAARAAALAREGHLTDVEAEALAELGHSRAGAGDDETARVHWAAALKIFESLGSARADELRDLVVERP
ncbi:AfsR/SARP family transcriptional regulator [Jiangella alkaliphila]|uniref:DNA-binding transcriptional activator of the SARP family n=1 Tax=Jiangella alkaliphila TaxID=419479 RepID=A0A1H2H840_9ACTN|nr:AfsR/SARP family transcriptional regulator [Jiangella alkaliphila]SDU27982.1 DNA-binding transcriptional activator of the SARP family [Jiangella alkaliphila]